MRRHSLTNDTGNHVTSSYRSQVALVLVAAFAISAAYTLYTTISGLTPDGLSATNPAMWAFYAVGFGMAALVRTDRTWAWWTVALLVLALIAVGVLVYPSMFHPPLQTPIGWLENDLYIGLLVVAEYLCVQRLRRRTLTPSEHPRRSTAP